MKIIYAAGNRIGSDSQLNRILKHLTAHDVKVAAYMKSSQSIKHIDWLLDSLYQNVSSTKEIQKHIGNNFPLQINFELLKFFQNDIEQFEPDLIISDAEVVSALLARKLKIKLWYCSPLHLLDGIEWKKFDLKYTDTLYKTRKFLRYFPDADRKFIYSPFGNLNNRPQIKNGFEWITPYYLNQISNNEFDFKKLFVCSDNDRASDISNIIKFSRYKVGLTSLFESDNIGNQYQKLLNNSNTIISSGETNCISDALFNYKSLTIAPSLKDAEALINAVLVSNFKLGFNIGQFELMNKFALEEFESSLNFGTNFVINSNIQIHERLNHATHSI